jgi:hypothetical protein
MSLTQRRQASFLEAYTKYLVQFLEPRSLEEPGAQPPSTSAPLAEATEAEAALVAEAEAHKDHKLKGQQSLAFLFAIIVP